MTKQRNASLIIGSILLCCGINGLIVSMLFFWHALELDNEIEFLTVRSNADEDRPE